MDARLRDPPRDADRPRPAPPARDPDPLQAGRRTLDAELAGLTALRDGLDASFVAAVRLMLAVRGRVIVSGMGKSGHVGRKIAATLASTGTPAAFVHPGEASHGDLGMITAEDAVLALSNSGETGELADLITYCRRFGVPLLAMTAGAESALARAATLLLRLPRAAEACPMGLAPTTSTTMMLALGDALAVALLEARGLTPDRYRDFHPGGRLGAKLLRVAQLMHGAPELPLIAPDRPMAEALVEMTARRFGCVGVVAAEGGRLVGIVTDGDLRRHMAPDLTTRAVAEIMTGDPRTIGPDSLAVEALALMNRSDRPVTALFVTDAVGAPVGILHLHDLLRAGVA